MFLYYSLMNISIELLEDKYEKFKKICKHFNLSEEEYLIHKVQDNIDNNIYLKNKYVFNKRTKVLSSPCKVIDLTNHEVKILLLLSANKEKHVTIDELITELNACKYTVRNCINFIRKKSCKDLILSKRDQGYVFNFK